MKAVLMILVMVLLLGITIFGIYRQTLATIKKLKPGDNLWFENNGTWMKVIFVCTEQQNKRILIYTTYPCSFHLDDNTSYMVWTVDDFMKNKIKT